RTEPPRPSALPSRLAAGWGRESPGAHAAARRAVPGGRFVARNAPESGVDGAARRAAPGDAERHRPPLTPKRRPVPSSGGVRSVAESRRRQHSVDTLCTFCTGAEINLRNRPFLSLYCVENIMIDA